MPSPLERLRIWRHTPTNVATIDSAVASPPPSPLAPIDLTSYTEVAGVMNLAARIGDILLSSGTSNQDTKAQIHAVTSAYGLYWCHVDITVNNITIAANIGVGAKKEPVSVFRVVRRLTVDFSKLSEVDHLIRSIQSGATPPDVAEQILNEIEVRRPSYGTRTSIVGWGIMGGGISVMLGGGPLVGVIALVTSFLIMGFVTLLDRFELPVFFQNVVGGFLATLPAAVSFAIAANLGFEIHPSQIIASGIVVLLAGLTLVQSLQDGITGAPVTASAHFFETLLFTGAVVAGVGIGIQIMAVAGISLPAVDTVAPMNFSSAWVRVLFGGVASVGFAIACFAKWSGVTLSFVTALAGGFFYHYLFLPLGMSAITAGAAAAVVIGLGGGLLSRRFQVPPLITAIAGITPMLPGLAVYRGMYAALSDQMLLGFTSIATALATACGLAAGVVFGEWVARRIRRPHRFNLYQGFRRVNRQTFRQGTRRPKRA